MSKKKGGDERRQQLFGPLLRSALDSLGENDHSSRIARLMKPLLDVAREQGLGRVELIKEVLQPELGDWARWNLQGIQSTPEKKCTTKQEWEKLSFKERGELAMQYLAYFFLVVMAESEIDVTTKQFTEFDKATRACISDDESIGTGAANLAFGIACEHLNPETRAMVFGQQLV